MPPNRLVKVTVVASSLLLVAAFVSYRAGAFDWPPHSAGTTIRTPPLPHATVVAPPRAQVAPPTAAEQQLFYGSKSPVLVEPQSTPQPTPPAPAQQSATPVVPSSPVIMSGSKSLMPAAPRQKAAKPVPKAPAADSQSPRRPLRPRRTSR